MTAFLSRICCLLFIACLSSSPAQTEEAPLKLGVMPFNSPQALVRSLQPLTTHLEQQLGRKVIIYTAPNYSVHIQQLLAGEFDLAITGPHFAALAEERSMHILYRYAAKLETLLVLPAGSPPLQPAQLRGKTIATSSRFAIITLGSLEWLEKNGLEFNKDYTLQEYPSHGAAIAAVASRAGFQASNKAIQLTPIFGSVSASVKVSSNGAPTHHAWTSPIGPLAMPIRNRIGNSTAPKPLVFRYVRALPIPLVAGLQMICRANAGIASASPATIGAIAVHFGPNKVATAGPATSDRPT